MPTLPIAESKNWGLILVPTKRQPFCVKSKSDITHLRRRFIGANFEPFVVYNISMRRQKNLYSCRKLQQLEFCFSRVIFTDLVFGVELSLPPHGSW